LLIPFNPKPILLFFFFSLFLTLVIVLLQCWFWSRSFVINKPSPKHRIDW
jgi:hypothetical protein